MHAPVTSSHRRRLPHSHAADGEREEALEEACAAAQAEEKEKKEKKVALTSAVGEAEVSRGAPAALTADHVPPAAALPSGGVAGRPRGAGSVAVAGQSSTVVGRRQGALRLPAQLGRCLGAEETQDRSLAFHFHS